MLGEHWAALRRRTTKMTTRSTTMLATTGPTTAPTGKLDLDLPSLEPGDPAGRVVVAVDGASVVVVVVVIVVGTSPVVAEFKC